MAKRIAPAVRPERLTNIAAITDTVVEVMHNRFRDSSFESLLTRPTEAIDLAVSVGVKLGQIKPSAARQIVDAVRKAMDDNPGVETVIHQVCRTALASRKRGDLTRDRY